MATTRAQQIGIWIIAITMTVGTIASFVAIVLSNQNEQTQTARQQEDYERQIAEMQEQYLATLEPMEGYSTSPFNADEVTELKVEVLTEGSGETVKETDRIKANYFGWLSDGKMFDSSNKKDAADEPVEFGVQEVIEGWTKGLTGQKVGSVVKLTIPSDQAYGAQGSSGSIPANAPLQFIVKIDSIVAPTEE